MPSCVAKRTRSAKAAAGRVEKKRKYCRMLDKAVKSRTNEVLLHIVIHAVENGYGLSKKSQKKLLWRFGQMIEVYAAALDLVVEDAEEGEGEGKEEGEEGRTE